ncbi:putative transcriptional regulator [Halobacteroides halobius DSM 5150]|uniref:Putative transcriptional regulator n=1 Tax=Halobacteroides halobius (strain ATCC 35273 / DSM 5150 / MD-1) TaxID=748449 RepID=L0KA61_HALHC|nr:helix-turn-helix domain-containing protein [Halobacteroides halobius]AGB41259.1 putative transcriptional regulator [Halobacteroides halobius DSM 5150]
MKGKVLKIKNNKSIIKVMKALASESRMKILETLNNKEMNLNKISEQLDMPASSVTVNVKKLEEAGLIETNYQPGDRGSQKLCRRTYDSLLLEFPGANMNFDMNLVEMSMPIGNYKDFAVQPTCGLASEEGYIGILDDEQSFLEPEHIYAQLLWFKQGHIKYRFPNNLPANTYVNELELSMEICSEAPHYNEDWPSDVTVWINDVEIGTWTSPGDFGEQRGKLNPEWWNNDQTQHGLLKMWTVNDDGAYIDGKQISKKTLSDLNISDSNFIDVKIGIKEEARNIGGINLFGHKFGNYEQDIILRFKYNHRE